MSKRYLERGVSSQKEDVHKAIKNQDKGLFNNTFCKIVPDILSNDPSPYLQQHKNNPVNWQTWSKASLSYAKENKKPILLSIGYSSCHWCHVMEDETFANDSIASIMNENFINIKVDREENPDVDQAYMTASQLMTGTGGWPLNVITLPDGSPIYAGTYHTN